jgi:hypothetical protein
MYENGKRNSEKRVAICRQILWKPEKRRERERESRRAPIIYMVLLFVDLILLANLKSSIPALYA